MAWFDENKNFISGVNASQALSVVVAPALAKYARFCTGTTDTVQFMVINGTSMPVGYVAYS